MITGYNKRRGIHSLVAVCALIGFVLGMSAVLFVVLSEYVGITSNSTDCLAETSLHVTGENRAYYAATLRNLGTGTITSVDVTFVDDDGTKHGFYNDTVTIAAGEIWSDDNDSVVAKLLSGKSYATRATVIFDDGSMVECSVR